ncbi:MAG: hypothetical protein Q8O55_00155 [Dehalococcoidales bacterium]|nr:hypothetical protein [Dehalococcoidales bacterium]
MITIDTLFVINAVFRTGQIIASRGVYDLACQNPDFARFVQESLSRHVKGDWGDVDDEDKQTNDQALKQDTRLLSAYSPREGGDGRFPKHGVATIWIITEADRSATTILFPDEY